MIRPLSLLTITWLAAFCLIPSVAEAQGLIFQLPADGTWVRYEGTFAQKEIRPGTTTGELEIAPWIEHVWLKSVGTEMADYQGESVPCRWIEILVERGREKDGKVDTGKTGREIYKVLIPEAAVGAVAEQTTDKESVPAAFLPVVKGYRQIGMTEPKPFTTPVLQTYPACILVGYYRNPEVAAQAVDPQVGIGSVEAQEIKGNVTIERPNSRTIQETVVWKSPDVPFGTAAWSAKITREVKDAQAPRDTFQPVTEVNVELKAQETGSGAQSELTIP